MHTIVADKTKRVRIPDAKPGQVFAFTNNGDGTRTLTEIKPVEPTRSKVKFIKRGRYTVGHTDKQVSLETIKELLSEFP